MSNPKVFVLKVSKAVFTLAIALVNAGSVFGGVLIEHSVSDPTLAGASAVFLATASSALVAFLATEQQSAPSP